MKLIFKGRTAGKLIPFLVFAILLSGACKRNDLKKELAVQVNQITGMHKELSGVPPITPSDLAKFPVLSREEYARKYSNGRMQAAEATYKVLPSVPIGSQGYQGSCVGWGIGYAAHSILQYMYNPANNNDIWKSLSSPAYIYNQVKVPGDCLSGTYPWDALNLLYNNGCAPLTQMPYTDQNCSTQPTVYQDSLAALRKISAWRRIDHTSIDDIRYFINQGYPVPVCFDVNQSFDNIRNTGWVWNTNYGTRRAGHCVCIFGYDDNAKSVIVINSWGAYWGNNGYFYISYDNITNGCLNFGAVMFP